MWMCDLCACVLCVHDQMRADQITNAVGRNTPSKMVARISITRSLLVSHKT